MSKPPPIRENLNVDLEFPPESPRGRYPSRVEAVEEASITLAAPLQGNEVVPLFLGQRLAVVITSEEPGKAYRFVTTLLGQFTEPLPLIKIAPPSSMERVQRRRFFRENVLLRGVCRRGLRAEPSIPVMTKNLSGGGSLVRAPLRGVPEWLHQVKRGGQLWFELPLAAGLLFESLARVVRIHSLEVEAMDLALEFENLPDRDRERLIKFLFKLQREMLRKGLVL